MQSIVNVLVLLSLLVQTVSPAVVVHPQRPSSVTEREHGAAARTQALASTPSERAERASTSSPVVTRATTPTLSPATATATPAAPRQRTPTAPPVTTTTSPTPVDVLPTAAVALSPTPPIIPVATPTPGRRTSTMETVNLPLIARDSDGFGSGPAPWEGDIGPDGGVVEGFDGEVQVRFPAGAVTETVRVQIRALGARAQAPYLLSDRPFEVVAAAVADGRPVRRFQTSIAVEVAYDEARVRGDEAMLALFYYDEERQGWTPLPTQVDAGTNRLTAQTDHFTEFDVDVQEWEASRLPSVKSFQVSTFTGAGTYAYPLTVPAGPGGLAPELELTYNSQIVDGAHTRRQASWVGMGWSLDTGFVERDTRGSRALDDDVFTLKLNGVSSLLVPGRDGRYHTADERFLRIEYEGGDPTVTDDQGGVWRIWDKQGNEYRFEHRAEYVTYYSCTDGDRARITWRWSLTEAVNRFGTPLRYTYATERKVFRNPCNDEPQHGEVAVYPDTILYPHGRYRIRFVRAGRTDFEPYWLNDQYFRQVSRSRLAQVRVEHDADGDGTFDRLIRRYVLTHGGGVFPGTRYLGGGRVLTLRKIEEYGRDDAGPLPATEFHYDDGMHLTRVDNNYGGRVTFTYDAEPWHATRWHEDSQIDLWTDKYCQYGADSGWRGGHCAGSWYEVFEEATNEKAMRHFRPGATYKLVAYMKANTWGGNEGPWHARIGVDAGTTTMFGPRYNLDPTGGSTTVEAWVTLPADASHMHLIVDCSYCRFSSFHVVPVATKYRVREKRTTDGVTEASHIFRYRYDEPAMNDEAHSQDAGTDAPYVRPYSEFRGHAMVQEVGPDGRVTTTSYRQDDVRHGRAVRTQLGTQMIWEPFDERRADEWKFHDASHHVVERIAGDRALKTTNPDDTWVDLRRFDYTLTDGDLVQTQFRVEGSATRSILAVENADGYRWGIWVRPNDAGQPSVDVQWNAGDGWNTTALVPDGRFEPDTWYVLQLGVDDDRFLVRLWPRDTVGPQAPLWRYQRSMPAGTSWRFRQWTRNGTVWLDAYSEGRLFKETETRYRATEYDVDTARLPRCGGRDCTDLAIHWVRTASEKTLTFEGDAEFVGRSTEYRYDTDDQGGTQYGNRTHTIEKRYENDRFVPYRATRREFYPRDDAERYLVGLPAHENTYACPDGACPFDDATLRSSLLHLYDGADTYATPPSDGIETGQRTLVCFADAEQECTSYDDHTTVLYQDVTYDYDAWGNVTTETHYRNYGTAERSAGETAEDEDRQTTQRTYDPVYHTYKIEEIDPAGHTTEWRYDYTLGVPTTVIDPNRNSTTATYDPYGRLLTVRRPYDEMGQPSVRLTYHDEVPFWTEAEQKRTGSTSRTVRKFYDGLGRLIQQQTADVPLTDGARVDVVVDRAYDAYDRTIKATVPYTLPVGSGWRGRNFDRPATQTIYDVAGRPTVVTAPDGATQRYRYGDLVTAATDAEGRTTHTTADVFGRTVRVERPAGPTLAYDYDVHDRLVQVAKVGVDGQRLTTTIDYDAAGRKLSLQDPDMGVWRYRYDALGNLLAQTDARGVTTHFRYDELNRMTQKWHDVSDDDAIVTHGPVTYVYDEGGADANAVGHRTRMVDGAGVATWQYDRRGRIIEETRAITDVDTYTLAYEYDSADAVTALTYPDGEVVTTTYEARGLATRLESSFGTAYVPEAVYDAYGRLRELAHGNGVETTYAYYAPTEQGGRLERLHTSDASLNLRYEYDAVGNIERIVDRSATVGEQTHSFDYDDLDRLLGARATGGTIPEYDHEYHYDEMGRLADRNGGAYDYEANHPHAATAMGENRYAYDANGNMIERTDAEADVTYRQAWTAENKLARVTWVEDGRPYTTTFVYDGDGTRLLKIEDLPATQGDVEVTTVYVGTLYEEQRDTTEADLSRTVTDRFAAANRRASTAVHDGVGDAQVHADRTPVRYQSTDEAPYATRTPVVTTAVAGTNTLGIADTRWPPTGRRIGGLAAPPHQNPPGDVVVTYTSNDFLQNGGVITEVPFESFTGGDYDTWRDYDSGSGNAWRTNLGYDDSSWGSTKACVDESDWQRADWQPIPSTVLVAPSINNCNKSGGTYLFRGTFTAPTPNVPGYELAEVTLQPWSDDAAAWWINGTRIGRTDKAGPLLTVPVNAVNEDATNLLAIQHGNSSYPVPGNKIGIAWSVELRWEYVGPTQAPTFTSALDQYTGKQTVTLAWSDVDEGVYTYHVQWADNENFVGAQHVYPGRATTTQIDPGTDGRYYFRVRTEDAYGNASSWSPVVSTTRDTTPPDLPAAADETAGTLPNQWQNDVRDPEFTWPAADDAGSGVAQYHVYWGQSASGTFPYQSVGDTRFDPGPVSDDGTYYLRVGAVDAVGNASAWKTLFTFRYDGTAPATPGSAEESHGVADDTWQNGVVNPAFTWVAGTDATSGVTGYDVYWGTSPTGTSVMAQPSSAGYDAAPVASGDLYYLRARTRDGAGNTSAWRTLFTFKYDGSAPAAPTEATELNGADDGVWQNDVRDPRFSWTGAADDESGVAGYRVYWGPSSTGTATTHVGTAAFDPPALSSDGTYYLRVQTEDVAGNTSAWATLFTLKYDNTAPRNPTASEATLGRAGDDDWQNRVADPVFALAGAEDEHSGVAGYRVYWGPDANGTTGGSLSTSTTFDGAAVASGSTTYLRVQTEDAVGNASPWATLYTLRYDGVPPSIDDLTPADAATITDPPLAIAATLTDAVPGADVDPVNTTLFVDGTVVTPQVNTSERIVYTPTEALAPGQHFVTLRVADRAGNEAEAAWSFELDPSTWVEITVPDDGLTVTQPSIPLMLEAERQSGLRLTVTTPVTTVTEVVNDGTWQVDALPLQEGTNTVDVQVEDPTGNVAADSVTVTVDPAANSASVYADPAVFNPTLRPTVFHVTAQAGSGRDVAGWTVTVRDADGDTVANFTGDSAADGTALLWDGRDAADALVPDGTYTYTLSMQVTDGTVTETVTSAARPLEVRSAAPDAPLLSCVTNPTWFSVAPALAKGSAQPDGRVVVSIDGEPAIVTDVQDDGTWQAALPLVDGSLKQITATVVDAAGTESAPSSACAMGLSLTEPFVQPHATLSHTYVGLDTSVSLTATTRITGAPVAWVRATLPPHSTLLTMSESATAGTYTGAWTAPSTGSYDGVAVVRFDAEDVAQPVPNHGEQFVQPYLDLVPPTARLDWPVDRGLYATDTIRVVGRAEPLSTVDVRAVRASDGTVVVATTTSDALGAWQTDLTLEDGTYELTVRATDRAANVGPATVPVTVLVDTSGPTIGTVGVSRRFVPPESHVALTATVTDSVSGVAAVEAIVDHVPTRGDAKHLDLLPAGTTFASGLFLDAEVAEGRKPVIVRARDVAGNDAERTDPGVVVDGTPPTVTTPVLMPVDGAANLQVADTTLYYGPASTGNVAVAVEAGDEAEHESAGLAAVTFPEVFGEDAGEQTLEGVTEPTTYDHRYTVDAAQSISASFSVDVRDRAGNAAASPPFVVAWDETAPTMDEPAVSLGDDSRNVVLDEATRTVYYGPESSGRLDVGVTVADDLAGLRTLTFPSLFDAGGARDLAGTRGPERVTETYTIGGSAVASGTYELTVDDVVGNIAARTTFTVTRDDSGPTVAVTATVGSGMQIDVTWSGSDASGVAHYDVEYREGDGAWTGWYTDTTDVRAEFVGVPGRSSTYAFRVRATDRVGNVGDWQTVDVDATGTTVTKYYYLGERRVAMRRGDEVTYLQGDHLGSVSFVTDATGAVVHETRYAPFGEQRWSAGTDVTDFGFTGQRHEASFGLMDYNARYYDPALGRFISADPIVPDPAEAQSFDRYAYVHNNPVKHTDATGHWLDTAIDIVSIGMTINDIRQNGLNWENGLALGADVASLAMPVVAGGGMAVRAATKADEAADAVRVAGYLVDSAREGERLARRLAQVGTHTDEGRAIIKTLTDMSTQGPRNGTVVLGRFKPKADSGYKPYIEKAREMEATYFSTPESQGYDVWGTLEEASGVEPWLLNRQFLDDAIGRGDRFFVEADIEQILTKKEFAGTYLRRELEYLRSKGYIQQGQWFVPGG